VGQLRKPWSVVTLGFKNAFNKLVLSRQTYSLLCLWVLTWFSYLIFMKSQINILTISGVAISASLMVGSYFLPFRGRAPKIRKSDVPPINKLTSHRKQIYSQNNNKISPLALTTPQPPQRTSQVEKTPKQIALLENQNQEPVQIQIANKSREPSNQNNGCPKNLDYFTKKPRPKQTPEECFSCKNLITCVCLTSN